MTEHSGKVINFCPRCGAAVSGASTRFCGNCGYRLPDEGKPAERGESAASPEGAAGRLKQTASNAVADWLAAGKRKRDERRVEADRAENPEKWLAPLRTYFLRTGGGRAVIVVEDRNGCQVMRIGHTVKRRKSRFIVRPCATRESWELTGPTGKGLVKSTTPRLRIDGWTNQGCRIGPADWHIERKDSFGGVYVLRDDYRTLAMLRDGAISVFYNTRDEMALIAALAMHDALAKDFESAWCTGYDRYCSGGDGGGFFGGDSDGGGDGDGD